MTFAKKRVIRCSILGLILTQFRITRGHSCDSPWTTSRRMTTDSPVSDDSTSRVWSFTECREEQILTGNQWDIEYIEWHPTMALLVSSSKDNLITFWDPGTGTTVVTPYVSRALPSGRQAC